MKEKLVTSLSFVLDPIRSRLYKRQALDKILKLHLLPANDNAERETNSKKKEHCYEEYEVRRGVES